MAEEVNGSMTTIEPVYEKLSPSLNEEEKEVVARSNKKLFKNSFWLTPGCWSILTPRVSGLLGDQNVRTARDPCQTTPQSYLNKTLSIGKQYNLWL